MVELIPPEIEHLASAEKRARTMTPIGLAAFDPLLNRSCVDYQMSILGHEVDWQLLGATGWIADTRTRCVGTVANSMNNSCQQIQCCRSDFCITGPVGSADPYGSNDMSIGNDGLAAAKRYEALHACCGAKT